MDREVTLSFCFAVTKFCIVSRGMSMFSPHIVGCLSTHEIRYNVEDSDSVFFFLYVKENRNY